MIRPFFSELEDNFIITPALLVQVGRCECCQKVGGFSLVLSWLWFEIGLEFYFGTKHG